MSLGMPIGAMLQQQQQNTPDPGFPSSAAISGVTQTGLDAIRESQQNNPEWYPSSFSDALDNFNDAVTQSFEDATNPVYPRPTTQTVARRKPIDYFQADLAKHYGMGRSSAYQEALANTSYQRSVADMKAAGLNPAVLFGSGRGQGASSSVYASSGGSRGSRGRSGSGGDDKLFSGSVYSAVSVIGGLIGIAATGRPDGFWIGSQTAKGSMALLDFLVK